MALDAAIGRQVAPEAQPNSAPETANTLRQVLERTNLSGSRNFDARPGTEQTSSRQELTKTPEIPKLPESVVNLRRNMYEHAKQADVAESIEAAERGESAGKALAESKTFRSHGQIGREERQQIFQAMSSVKSRELMEHMQGYINHSADSKFQVQLERAFSANGIENTIRVSDPRTGVSLGTYRQPHTA